MFMLILCTSAHYFKFQRNLKPDELLIVTLLGNHFEVQITKSLECKMLTFDKCKQISMETFGRLCINNINNEFG